MSNLPPTRPGQRHPTTDRARRWRSCSLGALLWLTPLAAGAQQTPEEAPEVPGVIDLWAEWAVSRTIWKGQTVPFPASSPRPDSGLRLDSLERPLHVHASAGVPPERLEAVLEALERAHGFASHEGWPLPLADGGRGKTAGFDLYLQRGGISEGRVDTPPAVGAFDGAIAHGVLDAGLGTTALQACALQVLVEAGLLGVDPAEARPWRRATAVYAAWRMTGRFGCDDTAASELQAHPERGYFGASDGSGAALLLALLSERSDGGSGSFVRELWQFARQHSAGVGRLRGSPDLWEALQRALKNAQEDLEDVLQDYAVARYFSGSRASGTAHRILHELNDQDRVPLLGRTSLQELPAHLPHAEPLVHNHGSGYWMVETAGADPFQELKIWLRGEYGARWSLSAVRLDADGHELGRVNSPPRRSGKAYLPVLIGEGTARILLVVTKFDLKPPDADLEEGPQHSYHIIVDN